MVVLAERDRANDRLSPEKIDAIVEGTDLVLDFLDDATDEPTPTPAKKRSAEPEPASDPVLPMFIRCIGGRGQIDDAAASIVAFGLRERGFAAAHLKSGAGAEREAASVLNLICYASHPSEAIRRYTSRKNRGGANASVRHAIVDYDVATSHPHGSVTVERSDIFVGDVAAICRRAAHVVAAVSTLDQELAAQS